MTKEQNVLNFYVLCNKLKHTLRTGWLDWGVSDERIESIAEHIFGTQMLAVAMQSEFGYDVNLEKVILMLAIHETEETIIGDLTQFQISRAEKEKIGHEAVVKIFKDLANGETLKNLIFEFDQQKSKEARFAFWCDKLEADIQCKLYDEKGLVDLTKQQNNKTAQDETVKNLLDQGKTWSQMWMEFGQSKYGYDKNFLSVSNYAKNNKISK